LFAGIEVLLTERVSLCCGRVSYCTAPFLLQITDKSLQALAASCPNLKVRLVNARFGGIE
jgi:hypothetical protein